MLSRRFAKLLLRKRNAFHLSRIVKHTFTKQSDLWVLLNRQDLEGWGRFMINMNSTFKLGTWEQLVERTWLGSKQEKQSFSSARSYLAFVPLLPHYHLPKTGTLSCSSFLNRFLHAVSMTFSWCVLMFASWWLKISIRKSLI